MPCSGIAWSRWSAAPRLLDYERARSFWLSGLRGEVYCHGRARAAPRPVRQVLNLLGGSLEESFNAAVAGVAHPPGDTVLRGRPLAGGAEADALHLPGDQHR